MDELTAQSEAKYLDYDLIKDLYLKDEYDFWHSSILGYDRFFPDFIEAVESDSQFKDDIESLAEVIVKYKKTKRKGNFFKYFWKLRKAYLLTNFSKDEYFSTVTDGHLEMYNKIVDLINFKS